jgi:hypothetical protein
MLDKDCSPSSYPVRKLNLGEVPGDSPIPKLVFISVASTTTSGAISTSSLPEEDD